MRKPWGEVEADHPAQQGHFSLHLSESFIDPGKALLPFPVGHIERSVELRKPVLIAS